MIKHFYIKNAFHDKRGMFVIVINDKYRMEFHRWGWRKFIPANKKADYIRPWYLWWY